VSNLVRKNILRKNISIIEISDHPNIVSDYQYFKVLIRLTISIIDYRTALDYAICHVHYLMPLVGLFPLSIFRPDVCLESDISVYIMTEYSQLRNSSEWNKCDVDKAAVSRRMTELLANHSFESDASPRRTG
jgi:hypothetical protein